MDAAATLALRSPRNGTELDVGRVALVHDWLDTWRGGENVVATLLDSYPNAELFALVDFLPDSLRERIAGRHARTSFLQHLPGASRRFRWYLPLMPRAIESLDVGAYDTVISSSHAFAKSVRTRADQVHVCLCYTPMRYAWDMTDQYLDVSGMGRGLRGRLVRGQLARLREWDRATANRPDHYVAISRTIRERIARSYGREAAVVYPPVDTEFFQPGGLRGECFVTAGRWVPYKRVDLVVAAFRAMPQHRLIVVGDGPEAPRVHAAAAGAPNVRFVGEVSRADLRVLLQTARAFVYAAEEDFGILPVEAMACGTPVIAYGQGGVTETVRGADAAEPTGLFFTEQAAAAIARAVADFDTLSFDPQTCRARAEVFSTPRFVAGFAAEVQAARLAHAR